MKLNIVLDTSSLMENPISLLRKAFDKYDNVIISIVTIEELDNLKIDKNVIKAHKARRALKEIEHYHNLIHFYTDREVIDEFYFGQYNNDDIILSCAVFNNANICTEDYAFKIKANIVGVYCDDLLSIDDIYKGYKRYKFTTEEYNDFFDNKEDYALEFEINEYLIIDKEDGKSDEYRFDGNDFVRLKLPSSKIIKGENALQRCALDMLNNNDIDICAVLGNYGSGKSYLSLRMALNSIQKGYQSKILGVREAVGEGERIGYLKGDFEDKTHMFFLPLIQSLDGGEYELRDLSDRGVFETMIPYYLKGTTYHNTIIVCDEAEDLSERQIRLVGTRLGKDSRIFFAGDYNQGIIDSTTSNPLIKMCQELKGNPKFACIYLDADVRSEASKIFANLYKNN